MSKRKKVLIRGPILTRSGYGEHTRTVWRALSEYSERFDLYVIPTNWGKTGWLWEADSERVAIDEVIKKTQEVLQTGQRDFDISVQVTIPGEFEPLCPVNIGVTAGVETTRMSAEWVHRCNVMDKVLTVSNFSAETIRRTVRDISFQDGRVLKDAMVSAPVEVVHFPVSSVEPEEVDLSEVTTKFNFLSVALWGSRKNLENLVRWFLEEFHQDADVGLVLKTSQASNSHFDKCCMRNILSGLLGQYPKAKCAVYLLHGDLTDGEMRGLVRNDKIHASLNAAHGEGFCLPLFESMLAGKPIVAPSWSGHLDYLYYIKEKVRKSKSGKTRKIKKTVPGFLEVDYRLAPVQKEAVWPGVVEPDSMWCFPEENSFKTKIRELTENYDDWRGVAETLRDQVAERFSEGEIFQKFADAVWEPEGEVSSGLEDL